MKNKKADFGVLVTLDIPENFKQYEEDDLFFKYHHKNLDIILCKNIYIKHFGNSSSDKNYSHEIELNRNWHYMWSKFYYFKKNYSYFKPSVEDVKSFHKKRIKNALK